MRVLPSLVDCDIEETEEHQSERGGGLLAVRLVGVLQIFKGQNETSNE